MAVHGYPWARFYGNFEGKFLEAQIAGVFTEGYFGLGGKNQVNVNLFHGWGSVQHDSIDVGVFYRYTFGLWGRLSVIYSSRVFAHNYPQYEQKATLSYQIPFSFF